MATISEKQTRRNRVQFTMPRHLYEAHQRNLDQAKELGAIIDFNRDFERWFIAQVDQVAKELTRMKEEATKFPPAKPKVSPLKTILNHSQESSPKMSEQAGVADGNN